jgi:hypothetical protein
MDKRYSLEFDLLPAKSADLITGQLMMLVNDCVDKTGAWIWNATSGLPTHQKPTDYLIKGKGPIPPSDVLLRMNGSYEVDTLSQYNKAKGIDGFIFPIFPELVKLEDEQGQNFYRSNFGIHFDANVPGSAGCIVITDKDDFLNFCEVMRGIHAKGIPSIPLEVKYFPII